MHRVFVEIRLKTLHLNTSKSDQYMDLFDENTFSASPTSFVVVTESGKILTAFIRQKR
jgi:hypothetical protein